MKTVFNALNVKVRTCYDKVQPPESASGGEICIAYHCLGQCFTGCGKKGSHKTLSPADQDTISC
jgi:hypothetical protein